MQGYLDFILCKVTRKILLDKYLKKFIVITVSGIKW